MGDEKVCYLIREAPLEGGQFFKGGSILLPPKSAIPLEEEFFIKSEANAESEHNFSRGAQFSKGPGSKERNAVNKTGPNLPRWPTMAYYATPEAHRSCHCLSWPTSEQHGQPLFCDAKNSLSTEALVKALPPHFWLQTPAIGGDNFVTSRL